MRYILALLLALVSAPGQSVSLSGNITLSGSISASSVVAPVVAGDPYYQYNIAIATLDNNDAASPTVVISQRITIATNGTATKISVYASVCNGGNLKMGLYDDSGNLLGQGSTTVPNDAAAHDLEVTISGVSVSGNVWVGFISDSGQTWKDKAAAGNRRYTLGTTYGAQMANPFVVSGSDTVAERVGIFVTP